MEGLVKLIMKSLFRVQIRRDINETYYCKSETWMKTDFDENVLEYWKLPNGNYIVKMKRDDGLDDDCDIKNTLPAVLGTSILGKSRRILKNFFREKNGFFKKNTYYTDTDSLYIDKKTGMCWIKQIWLEESCVKVKMIVKQVVSFTVYF